MPKNFKLPKWRGVPIKDPRVAMRALIGGLLAANLAAGILAFHPFAGSADELRQQQARLSAQLQQLQTRIAVSRRLVDKVQSGRIQGDRFLAQYFLDQRTMSAILYAELYDMAAKSGIRMGQATAQPTAIEGSETLSMLTIQAGFEGSYADLTKFVNLVDKSPRFLIIENMQAAAPQNNLKGPGGQALNVTLKIDTFVKAEPGAAS